MIHEKIASISRADFPLLVEAKRLAPQIASKGEENDANGRVSDQSISALHEAGFFSMMVPESVGGLNANPVQVLSVVEELCKADIATGWVVMAANVATAAAAAFLSDAGFQDIFGKSRPIIAGAGAPTGKAEVVDGGYRLTGHWTYGSGCLHCDYFHAGAIVTEGGKPKLVPGTNAPEARTFLIPAHEVEKKGNWDVLGLRATGSIDYSVTDVFIPDDHTHPPSELVGKRGGDSYRIGVVGFSALGHTGVALGHGRRVLDELAALVNAPSGRPSALANLGGSDSFKEDFASAEAKLRAARALAFDVWNDISETVSRGEAVQVRQFTWARLALSHATTAMMENSIFAHRASGGVGLRKGTLERTLRDTFSATQHLVVSNNSLRDAGTDLLGLAEGKRWTPRGLVDAN
ncbi:acyl-CoA dehydrogenase family protein [Novosphingobium taihuense]|uniref:Alkylation response protein AidB-like acyl-CoA dehydrogenase n=1 Tax=Novosphingobium taihuense TaxID=260085 RepID=A0A7W7AC37_9SPHN|nr:acyl-CoA dehydrogenase family protein [Novosphingobium taihuense]MBB4614289.1 alkylation response protein AidB-like acyl-CoA dehydrogenase [Novosphingobium taihuense]TWH87136.1 alkylation response protein AidB-like acyl-CoA dehydrogenase [Novosphingobium taihuense]